MSEEAVRERVRGLAHDMAPIKPAELTSASRLMADLGYDSLGLLELAGLLEQELELPAFSEDDAMGIETVGDLEQLVLRTLAPVRRR